MRHERRISVQATAAGRRKGTKSRGKAKATPGKPPKSAGRLAFSAECDSRYYIPTRRPRKGRRLHSLSYNIDGSGNIMLLIIIC